MRWRRIVKTLTWRGVALAISTAVMYAVTGDLPLATTCSVVVDAVKTVAYYLHELLWERVRGS